MTKEEKKEIRDKSRSWELLRFIICGLASALVDFLTSEFVKFICKDLNSDIAIIIIATACGFITGVIVNYLLSTFWVYRNVANKKETKTPLFILKFVILSAGALALSIGVMTLCQWGFKAIWQIDISNSSLKEIFTFTFWGNVTFWCYFISFCLRTLIGLIWNYFTRKYFLYKAPKDNDKQ